MGWIPLIIFLAFVFLMCIYSAQNCEESAGNGWWLRVWIAFVLACIFIGIPLFEEYKKTRFVPAGIIAGTLVFITLAIGLYLLIERIKK